MEKKETLTNEVIRKKFVSQFELVNYAIRLAENMIRTGRDSDSRLTGGDNVALHVISDITEGRDKLVDLTVNAADSDSHETKGHTTNGNVVNDEPVVKKLTEGRKRRASTIVK